MLLVGHEHFMKIAEEHLTLLLILAGIALLIIALKANKAFKAHAVAFALFP